MQQLSSPASVFCVAALSDAALLAEWETHLTPLIQAKHIALWSERHLMAGTPRVQQMHDRLDHADFIVLLVSAAFFADDECIALMEQAIKRTNTSDAHLIPLLLRPVSWRESLLVPYSCMPSNNRPITQWSNRDAAFEACVRDIRRLLGLPVTAPLTHRQTRTEPPQNQNRIRMLRRVMKIWIDGLLMQSLHDAARIELHLQDRPDVLENPWQLQVQELDQAPKNLPSGTSIVQVYDRSEGELLILGEPGAGKTTLLLELARVLLERAENDEQLSMPIVFHLSSWAEKRQSFHVWLEEELWAKYQVPRKIGKGWIDTDQVLPLLDGLDEVAKDARSACVEQINDYYQSRLERGSSPIVVCCRSEEYAALSTRVVLQHAVSILPLTDSQINTYLEQAGEQVKGLRQALDKDAELHNLARQPLMLTIFTLAYQGARAADVPAGETREGMQRTVFAKYVEGMLKRRGQSKRWKPEQMVHWLSFLAKQMHRHTQTVFMVENLQPTWLSWRQRILYQCCVWPVWLIQGLDLVETLTWLWKEARSMLVRGIDTRINLVETLTWSWKEARSELVSGSVGEIGTRINPVETLTWSWKGARSGLVLGLLLVLFYELGDLGAGESLPLALFGWLFLGLFIGLLLALLKGSAGRQISERLALSPNEGIWRSGKNGLFRGLFGGLLGGLLLLPFGLQLLGLFVGLAIASFRGTEAFVMHFLLRFQLSLRGNLPWDLVAFLDEAAERLLLRKVGGSYIFVHRQLLDYFASLDEPRSRSVE